MILKAVVKGFMACVFTMLAAAGVLCHGGLRDEKAINDCIVCERLPNV